MIKNLRKNDIQVTPFVATKSWILSNSTAYNQNLILVNDEDVLALEFIDYEGGDDLPILNRQCNIALGEVQQSTNSALYEEGEKIEGTFYPETDPKNNTGTYKRLVYNQIKNAFYNDYQDPTKMFGLENIDFQLSETKKFLADEFKSFNVSKKYFGEKILENSVILVDNSLDDTFQIVDDGKGNIIAKENLFSKIQEVKKFINSINTEDTSTYCDSYYQDIELRQAGNGGSYGTAGTSGYYPANGCQPW